MQIAWGKFYATTPLAPYFLGLRKNSLHDKSLEPCKRYNIKVLKIFQIIMVQFQILLFLSWGGFFDDTMESQALQPLGHSNQPSLC